MSGEHARGVAEFRWGPGCAKEARVRRAAPQACDESLPFGARRESLVGLVDVRSHQTVCVGQQYEIIKSRLDFRHRAFGFSARPDAPHLFPHVQRRAEVAHVPAPGLFRHCRITRVVASALSRERHPRNLTVLQWTGRQHLLLTTTREGFRIALRCVGQSC